jgi:hypothetical protein
MVLVKPQGLHIKMKGTAILLKAIAEADDPNAVCEQFEKDGLFKMHQEAGNKLREYAERIGANSPALPEPSPDSAENQ